jgi:hypothetical protein
MQFAKPALEELARWRRKVRDRLGMEGKMKMGKLRRDFEEEREVLSQTIQQRDAGDPLHQEKGTAEEAAVIFEEEHRRDGVTE